MAFSSPLVLAQTGGDKFINGNKADGDAFFGSGFGQMIQEVAKVLAMIVVVIGIYQTGKAVVAGRGGTAVKSVIGTIVLAAFLFQLQLLADLINWMIKVIGSLFESFSGAFGE